MYLYETEAINWRQASESPQVLDVDGLITADDDLLARAGFTSDDTVYGREYQFANCRGIQVAQLRATDVQGLTLVFPDYHERQVFHLRTGDAMPVPSRRGYDCEPPAVERAWVFPYQFAGAARYGDLYPDFVTATLAILQREDCADQIYGMRPKPTRITQKQNFDLVASDATGANKIVDGWQRTPLSGARAVVTRWTQTDEDGTEASTGVASITTSPWVWLVFYDRSGRYIEARHAHLLMFFHSGTGNVAKTLEYGCNVPNGAASFSVRSHYYSAANGVLAGFETDLLPEPLSFYDRASYASKAWDLDANFSPLCVPNSFDAGYMHTNVFHRNSAVALTAYVYPFGMTMRGEDNEEVSQTSSSLTIASALATGSYVNAQSVVNADSLMVLTSAAGNIGEVGVRIRLFQQGQ